MAPDLTGERHFVPPSSPRWLAKSPGGSGSEPLSDRLGRKRRAGNERGDGPRDLFPVYRLKAWCPARHGSTFGFPYRWPNRGNAAASRLAKCSLVAAIKPPALRLSQRKVGQMASLVDRRELVRPLPLSRLSAGLPAERLQHRRPVARTTPSPGTALKPSSTSLFRKTSFTRGPISFMRNRPTACPPSAKFVPTIRKPKPEKDSGPKRRSQKSPENLKRPAKANRGDRGYSSGLITRPANGLG